MEWYLPSGDVERDHLEKELENISMDADEDPKLFFARAEGNFNVLFALGIHKSDSEVVRLIAHWGLEVGRHRTAAVPAED